MEHIPSGSEQNLSLEAARDQAEKLLDHIEDSAEINPDKQKRSAEHARSEALDTAISVETGGKEKKTDAQTTLVQLKNNRSNREASFKHQMKAIQADMSLSRRTFSKVIHNRVIEKTSDVAASTIARPNAILAGSICAFILTLGVYVVAKSVGYRLSGFETIAAFIFGWILGIAYDYLRLLIAGKK